MNEPSMFPPVHTRLELHQTDAGIDVEVWQYDNPAFLCRTDNCTSYPSCSPDEAFDVVASTLDSLWPPDPF